MLVLYCILVLVMLVGIIGAVVPAIPGSSLILGAILVWGVVNGFTEIGWALGTAIAVLLLSVGVDQRLSRRPTSWSKPLGSNWGDHWLYCWIFGAFTRFTLGWPSFRDNRWAVIGGNDR